MNDELEAIRQKRLKELQDMQNNFQEQQIDEQDQLEQQIQQLEGIIKQKFTREALLRYGSLKTAHPEQAVRLLVVLSQLMQSGQIDTVDDQTLKKVLIQIAPKKKEFNIRRK